MSKKKDTLCFDIGTLDQEQKVQFAKNLKSTVDKFNKEVSKSDQTEEESEEEPKVKVTLVEKEEPKPIVTEIITKKHEIPVISHGKILDDYGNVIGTF